jgi:outer membrane protein assembly factor BamB
MKKSYLTLFALLLPLAVWAEADWVKDSGIHGGLAVRVGCDNHDELASLAKRGGFLIQALSNDAAAVAKAQKQMAERKLTDKVWISLFDGRRLPFADNVVNLLVADADTTLSRAEMMRVLTPRGVLIVGTKKTVKPVPPNIDEWTHHLHDASGNAVAKDTVVGPPERLKWAAKPLWSKHHNATANVNAMVSAKGRVFMICDESPVSIDPTLMPDQWNLVARDAFNGILLWRIPINLWGTKAWNPRSPRGRNNQPTHIGRRLVAVGDRVYVTLGYNAAVSELDAATGKVLRVLDGTQYTDAILWKDGKLILSINKGPQHASKSTRREPSEPPVRKEVVVFDLNSGKMLWRKGNYLGLRSKTGYMDRINHLTVAVGADRLFFFSSSKEIVCLSQKNGEELWRKPRPMAKVMEMRYNLRVTDRCTLMVHKDVLLLAQPEPTTRFGHKKGIAKIYAFAADTGEPLWNREMAEWGWAEPPDMFIIKDELWIFDLKTFSLLALNPDTGKELRRWNTAEALNKGHHHRCYRNRAAESFVLTSHRGIELFDLESGENSLNPFVRGACQFGFLPCNGLLYSTPHACSCFLDGKLNGILALSPAGKEAVEFDKKDTDRLRKGPAYGKVSSDSAADPDTWPTYRHDVTRSGSSSVELPLKLKTLWTTSIVGEPTACVIGDGKVLLTGKQTRRLHAFDEKTGALLWDRVMNGPMDSPPTLYKGMALCGGRDGWVTCLRLADGEVVWRFRAAPTERWIHVYGALESASPVSGSVLVKDDTVYFSAGRSSYLDGGIFVFALDPRTGAIKEQRRLATSGQSSDACLADILVSSGESIFMRNRAVFGPGKADRNFLYSRSGLLDEAWFNRAPWGLGRQTRGATNGIWSSGGGGQSMDPRNGQYIVHDDKQVFSVVAASAARDAGIFKPAKTGYRLNCAKVDGGKASWSAQVPVRIMSMVNTPTALFAAGTPDIVDPDDPWAALAGRKGGRLLIISKEDGSVVKAEPLAAAPVLDGLAAAHGRLFIVLKNGQLSCRGL